MQRHATSMLLVAAIMSAFWAYTVIDALLREFSGNVTFIDLGVIFLLGLISGALAALSLVLGGRRPQA